MGRRYLSRSEVKRLRGVIKNRRDLLILNFIYETQINVNELSRIRSKHINRKDQTLTIPAANTKNNTKRTITLPISLIKQIPSKKPEEFIFSTRQSPHTTSRRIQQLLLSYGNKANLGRINPSILRQSSIVHSLLNKTPIKQLEENTGIQNLQPYVYDVFQLKDNLLK